MLPVGQNQTLDGCDDAQTNRPVEPSQVGLGPISQYEPHGRSL